MEVKIEQSWKEALAGEFEKPYFASLVRFLHEEKASGQRIYPPGSQIFKAFELTPVDQVKVVILGQDPYHGAGQAMGLSFSVHDDLGITMSGYPDLEKWARQGVLLLNAVLTVRAGQPASHSNIGWTEFTDAVIKYISDHCTGVVFLLWGNFARSKKALIDTTRHYVLEAAHPSPLARGAFFGCRHFSKTNEILAREGKTPIDWQL